MVEKTVTGGDVLGMIERMLDGTRRELEAVATRLERSTTELEKQRQAELGVLSVLARIRLREIESGVADALDETGTRVKELLAKRGDAQAAVGVELGTEQDALAKLEQERAAQHAVVDSAEKDVGAAEAAAQQSLAADAAYGAQLEKAHASDRVASTSEEKARGAHTDRTDKGKPYEADPLFAYLWSRGYGTSRYRAGPLARMLDGWVARVDDFEPLRQNYWMLNELPARFDEHSKRMRALADEDIAAVRALESAAAAAAGVRSAGARSRRPPTRSRRSTRRSRTKKPRFTRSSTSGPRSPPGKTTSRASARAFFPTRCAESRCARCASARAARRRPRTTRRSISSP